jgi:hypothetical protein
LRYIKLSSQCDSTDDLTVKQTVSDRDVDDLIFEDELYEPSEK